MGCGIRQTRFGVQLFNLVHNLRHVTQLLFLSVKGSCNSTYLLGTVSSFSEMLLLLMVTAGTSAVFTAYEVLL